jgi:N-glycosylase/DNA lyase
LGESWWQSPAHQTTIEIDTRDGVKRRSVAGIRSPNYFGGHVKGILTDRAIKKYIENGTYEVRSAWLNQKRLEKAKEFLPRLVYDPLIQDFI